MEINEWINLNYNRLYTITKKITSYHKNAQDLLHDIICEFIIDKKAQELVDNGNAIWYLIRIITLNWNSKSSRYHSKYRKHEMKYNVFDEYSADDLYSEYVVEEEYDSTNDYIFDLLLQEYENLDWYSKEVMNLKLNHNILFSKLSKETNIPVYALYYNYAESKKKIKKNITSIINSESKD